jgi:hypothetical protein
MRWSKMTKRYAIISCGKDKLNRDAQARDMYTGPFFSKMKEYAETCTDGYWILSSKYGLIEPDKAIEPYNKTPTDITEEEREEVRREAINKLQGTDVNWKKKEVELVILGGQDYRDLLKPVAQKLPTDVQYPLQQDDLEGLGDQMAWLKNKIEDAEMADQRTLGEDL